MNSWFVVSLFFLYFVPVYLAEAPLSTVNACLKSAKAIPGNSLNGRTLAGIVGYGWDDLQSVVTKPVFLEEFKACQAEPTGSFLLPDNVIATPVLQTSLDRMAEYYDSFNDYKETVTNTFTASAGGGYGMFQASGSFSTKHQESKETFAKYKSSLLHTKLVYKSFNLYRDPVGSLEPGFIDRIEQVANAVSRNLTYQAKYLAEVIVKDFGTHYISTASTGAVIEQETFIDSNYTFTDAATLDSVRASAAASFGSYFHASVEDTHEHSKIATNGGPDVNKILSMSDNGTFEVDNLVSFNHDGDWLYELVVPKNFPNIDITLIFPTQVLLKNSIELYYKKNTIRGCTDMSAPNYDFQANFDDGSCKSNNDSYPFGGFYQTCLPLLNSPQWRCDNFTQDNLFMGAPLCEGLFYESVLLLDEVYHFEDRIVNEPRKECHRNWYFKKECHYVDYYVHYKDSVYVNTYWCRKNADANIPAKHGAMFGGLFEDGKPNELTGESGCPGSYQSYRFGRSVTVCISYQYEMDHAYAVPFEKFFSCQTPESEKACSSNFTQRLASVENNCDVYFCVRKQIYNQLQHPVLKRPPYTSDQLASSNYSVDTIRAVYKGVELFSISLDAFLDTDEKLIQSNDFINSNINAYIDEVHERVLFVSNNLTASASQTLDNIRKLEEEG